MIVKMNGIVNYGAKEKVRERIKEQMKEGLIVHDESIEITFSPDRCIKCGCDEFEVVTMSDKQGVIYERIKTCENCGHVTDLMK